jgi:hypothetical protein
MADSGAREIRSLLETSSDTLAESMSKIGDGLKLDDPDSPVGKSAFEGIREARTYYGGLARRIRRIDTSADAKPDVLDAIERLNSGLKLFAKGLADEGTNRGDRIASGAERTQEAAADLARATKALT